MNNALLLIGGNIGNREKALEQATQMIGETVGTITDQSSVYETAPWGFSSEKAFLNQVLRVESMLDPHEILEKALFIEQKIGRTRNLKGYSSRLIDIDILLIDGLQIHDKQLDVPHPRLHLRNFALIPMAEIAGSWMHPVLKKRISEIAENCNDTLQVEIYKKKNSTDI